MFTPHHVSHVTCHMSHVPCHMSHVTCHMSHVMCHVYLFLFFNLIFFKGGSLSLEDLLSTGPIPSSFSICEISGCVMFLVLVIFQFWWHFSFQDISVLVTFQSWGHLSLGKISVMVKFQLWWLVTCKWQNDRPNKRKPTLEPTFCGQDCGRAKREVDCQQSWKKIKDGKQAEKPQETSWSWTPQAEPPEPIVKPTAKTRPLGTVVKTHHPATHPMWRALTIPSPPTRSHPGMQKLISCLIWARNFMSKTDFTSRQSKNWSSTGTELASITHTDPGKAKYAHAAGNSYNRPSNVPDREFKTPRPKTAPTRSPSPKIPWPSSSSQSRRNRRKPTRSSAKQSIACRRTASMSAPSHLTAPP